MMSTPDGIAARGAQARNNLVVALRECCDVADAVESLGQELLESSSISTACALSWPSLASCYKGS